jgi:16S rRNA (guanine527-N7)-methyltransferase
MSATGRPERECRSAQRAGVIVCATGRPERECRSAQREGVLGCATGRPNANAGAHSAQAGR